MCSYLPPPPHLYTYSQLCFKLIKKSLSGLERWLRRLEPLTEDPGFDSEYTHGGSQTSRTLVSGVLCSLLTSTGTIHVRLSPSHPPPHKTFIHINKKKLLPRQLFWLSFLLSFSILALRSLVHLSFFHSFEPRVFKKESRVWDQKGSSLFIKGGPITCQVQQFTACKELDNRP